MKNNAGTTLLEIMLSLSLFIVVLLCAGGFYLSSLSISADIQNYARIQANAQTALMHIEKYVRNAASELTILPDSPEINDVTLQFLVYDPALFDLGPTVTCQYLFDASEGELVYSYGKDINVPEEETMLTDQLTVCEMTVVESGTAVLNVSLTAVDEEGNQDDSYTVSTAIESCLTAAPAVYSVP